MALGLIGTKLGMTRVFQNGVSIPVTVIHVQGNHIAQEKTVERDGYRAVQVAYGDVKENRISKAENKHLAKFEIAPKRHIREFRLEEGEEIAASGTELKASHFSAEQFVDVIGLTKGRGFQGVVKRYNFAGSPMTHGSMMHRRTGSIGCRSTPGLVFKNKKMPGHMGDVRRTVQNLKVVAVRDEEGVVLIKGSVPGSNGQLVVIRPSKKKKFTPAA